MELETVIGFLVALGLPLWLLVEQIMPWRRASKQSEKPLEVGKLSRKPASGGPARTTRPQHAMRVADQRKTA